jgi:hypothetical protein
MLSLSNYNVIYMFVHSGSNQWGESLIATGVEAHSGPADPTFLPYLRDKTAIVTGVAGTTTNYYGVVSEFFQYHVGPFPQDALIFINGCSLLNASLLWNDLAAKNVGSMVTWDGEVMSPDEGAAASTFFDAFTHGQSVSDSVASVLAHGYGQSTVGSTISHLGYRGVASLTLPEIVHPPAPTPAPTDTPSPMPSPTATSTPTPTAGPYQWPQPPPLGSGIHHWHLP